MKVNKPILLGMMVALVAMAAPLPMASAHICLDNVPGLECVPGVSCDDPPAGTFHAHILTSPGDGDCIGWAPDGSNHCPHASPHAHTYGTGGSAGARSDTVTGGDEVGAGIVTVFETNPLDCDGDGIPGDYDGDWETGVGGGFFGYGSWATSPICNYGLTVHGGAATVLDSNPLVGNNVAFVIGADDRDGPVISTDPVTLETTCSTSGSITPCPDNDPNQCGPTDDPDDCLSDVYVGSGTTCGAGGDGGYWVFLNGVLVTESGGILAICGPDEPPCCPNPLPIGWRCETLPSGHTIVYGPPTGGGVSNAPTSGTITA